MSKIAGFIHLLRFIANHPLNKDHKSAAIRRFVRWQIGSRLVPGPVAVPFANNSRLLVSRGMTGATGNIYTGLHEFDDMGFLLHALRPDDLFVDVGANVGSYTILAGAAIGARCLSFEPIPSTYKNLMQNVSLNSIGDRVDAQNIGIGHENGELKFTSGLDTVNHVLSDDEPSAGAIVVPIKPLDDVVGDRRPRIIKIDVEGFETNVINGASGVLSQDSLLAVIMELNGSGDRYGFDETAIHKKMLDHGFSTFTYAPYKRELIALDGKNVHSGNTIYIKDISFARERVKSAPAFTAHGQSV